MRVDSHDSLRAPDVRRATRVVVYDDHGNPIGVFIQVAPGHVFLSVKGHKDFEASLLALGIKDTAVATVVTADDLGGLRVG